MFEKLFENRLSQEEAREFLIELYKKGESAEDIMEAAKIYARALRKATYT